MTLIAERIPAGFRGRAVALGNIGWPLGTLLAAVFAYFLDPAPGWRATFALAAFPALLVLWIRACVPESELWRTVRKVERDLKRTPPLNAFSGHILQGFLEKDGRTSPQKTTIE